MNIKEKLTDHTQRRQLFPSRNLISDLMLNTASLSQEEMETLLLGQVGLAKKLKQTQWLKTVAQEADQLCFQDHGWVDSNIYRRQRPPKKASQMPTATRDIRLKDPTFPCKVEMVSPEEGNSLSMKQLGESLPETPAPEKKSSEPVQVATSSGDSANNQEQREASGPVPGASSGIKTDKPERMEVSGPVPGASSDPSKPDRAARDRTPPGSHRDEQALRRSPRKHKGSREAPKRDDSRRSSPRRAREQAQGARKGRESEASRRRHASPRERRSSPARRSTTARRRSPVEDRREARKRRSSKSPEQRRGRNDKSVEGKKPRLDQSAGSTGKKVQKPDVCPVPGCHSVISRHHAFGDHVPRIFDEDQELTEEVSRRRVSALRLCARSVLGTLNLEELARYVSDIHPLHRGELWVNKAYQKAMIHLCTDQGLEAPEAFDFVGTVRPWALIHWRLMLVVIASMPQGEVTKLRQSYPAVTPVESEGLPEGFDSHFHLDRTSRRANRKEVQQVIEAVKPTAEFRIKVTGGIAVYCDPPSYPTEEVVAELAEAGFGVAIGLHPKPNQTAAYDESDWEAFERCVTFPGVKALGEVGLDYATDPDKWPLQHEVLDRALKSLRPEHVLVLHNRPPMCRPDGDMVQLLYQLKGVVPKEQKIHVHCFLGTPRMVELWLREFPNTHFGYCGDRILRASREEKEALRNLSEDRILLETDAPYFSILGCVGLFVSIVTPILLSLTFSC